MTRRPAKLKKVLRRFRSAITGRWIKKTEADQHPETSVSETVKERDA